MYPGTYLLCNHVILNFILQEEQKELDEITAKRQKKGRNEDEAPGEEKTILHGTVVLPCWNILKQILISADQGLSPTRKLIKNISGCEYSS